MRALFLPLLALSSLPAAAEVPRVVTDLPPVQSLVAQVMGDLGNPGLLLDPGVSEHDLQLRPSQMQALSDADLVVWIGPALSPVLAELLAERREGQRQLALLEAPGTHLRSYAPHDEEVKGEQDDHDHDHGHDHEGTDPHAWLDPDNAVAWTRAIAAALIDADPEHAADYAAGAEATLARIAALDGEMQALLSPVADRPFLTYHDAYGYLADHFGLAYLGALASGDAAAPGAGHLAELQSELSALPFPCLFPEAQHDAGLITTLAEGSGARIGAALDPTGSLVPAGAAAYDQMMRKLAVDLAACLSEKG